MNIATEKLDICSIRNEFSILNREVLGKPLIYFDNAATTQKPKVVTDALVDYYSSYNANIHRGNHTLAEEATTAYENTRISVQKHIKARSKDEIIFTKSTTESINLVAYTWGKQNIKPSDEIIISTMEHHSNLVPWQILCKEKNAVLKVIPMNDNGELLINEFEKQLTNKTKLVAITHTSNSLGTINPVKKIVSLSHAAGAIVLIDGAQSVAHLDINVQDIGCDFFAFSAHKLYGPTGVGILYGKEEILKLMPPFLYGGEMVSNVTFGKTTYNSLPYKFEAGTPNIADVIAFNKSIDLINQIGINTIKDHEDRLLSYATNQIIQIPKVRIIGRAKEKTGILSFIVDGIHTQDIGTLLDNQGIAVRTGHHCAQPSIEHFEITGTVRASFAIYNTQEEIDSFIIALNKSIDMLR